MRRFTSVPSLIEPLRTQIRGLVSGLRSYSDPRVSGIVLTGSCSRGEATYRSDVDLLVILGLGPGALNYSVTREIRDSIESHFKRLDADELLRQPLPVEVTVVLESVFETQEPAMLDALNKCLLIQDYSGKLKDRLAPTSLEEK